MKIMKKIMKIVLIFAILQMFIGIFGIHSSYGFFDNVFQSGKKWSEMGNNSSSNITQNANSIFKVTDEIYNTIRAIGAGIFMIAIAATVISLSMKGKTGKDIASIKVTLTFIFILALLFIFAEQILAILEGILQQFQDIM